VSWGFEQRHRLATVTAMRCADRRRRGLAHSIVLAALLCLAACDDSEQNQKGAVTELNDRIVCIENVDDGVEFCATIGPVELPSDIDVGSCVQARSDFGGVEVGSDPRSDPERLIELKSADGC
jgi:hypothetical protein